MTLQKNRGFQIGAQNDEAAFSLKLHRGEGMCLLAMNWKKVKPPRDFVGFAIEYKGPNSDRFFALTNRIAFADTDGSQNKTTLSTRLSPIQKFRWVHFPKQPELAGEFTYRVTPVFMNTKGELSYGEPQKADIQLMRETYPGKLNVAFTRGFVSSQAFVDHYGGNEAIRTLLPSKADQGLTFKATHKKAEEAYAWMGFEAREVILNLLDKAIKDKKAEVKVVAYDLNEPAIVTRLEKLGNRLQIIIDDDGAHGKKNSGENQAEKRLVKSAGKSNVIRQHMGKLQHNKTIIINGPKTKAAIGGSTNFSWRGVCVQSNNVVSVHGSKAIQPFLNAFDLYWNKGTGVTVSAFRKSSAAKLLSLGLNDLDVRVAFSPHASSNALLTTISKDIGAAKSSLFFSLAFLYQTKGLLQNAIKKLAKDDEVFCYGLSDKKVGGLDLLKPDGKVSVLFPQNLKKNIPEPFRSEPTGGGGTRMHHKFAVIDFDKPSARVYTGSYNFSVTADTKNGENLWLIKDRRIATSYMVASLAMFDHYHFRIAQEKAKNARKQIMLAKPPQTKRQKTWWDEDYSNPRKILDRKLFA